MLHVVRLKTILPIFDNEPTVFLAKPASSLPSRISQPVHFRAILSAPALPESHLLLISSTEQGPQSLCRPVQARSTEDPLTLGLWLHGPTPRLWATSFDFFVAMTM